MALSWGIRKQRRHAEPGIVRGWKNLSKILWDPPWLHGEARGDQKITIGGRLGGVKDNYYLVERPESKSSEGDMQQFHEFSKGRNCGVKRYLKRDAAQKVIIQWSSPPASRVTLLLDKTTFALRPICSLGYYSGLRKMESGGQDTTISFG